MNPWAKDLNPKYQPLSDAGSRILLAASLGEGGGKSMSDEQKQYLDGTFLVKILRTRIEVLKLPIKFTDDAVLATLAFVDRPGSIVALLIDCLNAYEGEEVTVDKLVNLYPTGFYDEDTLIRYVDNFLKPRKVKWSEVY